MQTLVKEYLDQIVLTGRRQYRQLTLYALQSHSNGATDYITLAEAMEVGSLVVTEVSEKGTVPQLKVRSSADRPILLLDGEELAGGKQNRVLNTSILFPEKDERIIPVSCTERGRWGYTSDFFVDSGLVMHHSSRARKHRSVTESLHSHHEYTSAQGEVWAGVDGLHSSSGTRSHTSAMRDAFIAREKELKECLEVLRPLPGQQGLLVMVNGHVVGFDVVSSAAAYTRLHERLVKSYAMDGLLAKNRGGSRLGAKRRARRFLASAGACSESRFESIGYGWDLRYQGAQSVGSALVHEDKVIHAAFFRLDANQPEMGTVSQRRRYRTRSPDDGRQS